MKSIEERAIEYAQECESYKDSKMGYMIGATDQRDIDIQRACEWMDEYFDRCFGVSAWQFCESAKNEITKVMKRE